eukprot:scaffold249020_cov28-Tisochrysis_lutea.AAC.3
MRGPIICDQRTYLRRPLKDQEAPEQSQPSCTPPLTKSRFCPTPKPIHSICHLSLWTDRLVVKPRCSRVEHTVRPLHAHRSMPYIE